ncbi:MBL fold metallo-hydrolase [Paracoccus sp. SCSIO 75233]|uniref:MBL fold metallo-hydrolase n=1 Tax=Paracoccus sp. SCSIO 75233 TaxID=3017782 RepID=UPI0022F1236D|nr:MBL fold metallo-hydrolase [Paracoccus sp. SCSIO 75233]WBU52981.1 MBL fold metallo-hydrolase [Paracoccus sp. SCSIO 75233]
MAVFQVGDYRIQRIEEILEKGYKPEFMLRGFSPDMFDAHPEAATENFFDRETGRSWSSVHSWLITHGDTKIIVDTCSGNGKARALPVFQRFHMLELPYLENLADAGLSPDDIDIVFNTHLHIDHVGWNTRKEGDAWVPTFGNARYIFGRAEMEHWRPDGVGPRVFPDNIAVIEDSVVPCVDAGVVEYVDDGDEIYPGLRVEAAPGHTATQLVLKHDGPDGAFVISADILHYPIQIYEPHVTSRFCEDPHAAEKTRRELLEWAVEREALVLPMHFGRPHAAYIERRGEGYGFRPAESMSSII